MTDKDNRYWDPLHLQNGGYDAQIRETLESLPRMTTAPAGFHFEPPYGELVPNDWPHEWDGDWYWWGKSPEERAAARAQLRQAWGTIIKGQSS